MSEPSGSIMSRVSDKGTQRTAGGGRGVDPECPSYEETSSSGFKDVSSRVDTDGVITWLRPIEEDRADAFWKRYSFPPNVLVAFPSTRLHFVACKDEDRGGMNFMYWLKVHISEGPRFPLPPLAH